MQGQERSKNLGAKGDPQLAANKSMKPLSSNSWGLNSANLDELGRRFFPELPNKIPALILAL